MLHLLDAWERYLHIETWEVHAMTVLWLVFFLAVFVADWLPNGGMRCGRTWCRACAP
jgi:hypothetical protein